MILAIRILLCIYYIYYTIEKTKIIIQYIDDSSTISKLIV